MNFVRHARKHESETKWITEIEFYTHRYCQVCYHVHNLITVGDSGTHCLFSTSNAVNVTGVSWQYNMKEININSFCLCFKNLMLCKYIFT